MQNVTALSASSPTEIRRLVGEALSRCTDVDLDSDEDIPAVMVEGASVMPRRVTRKKIVFLCYRGGKLLGSAMIVRP